MKRIPIASEVLSSIGYDHEEAVLEIEFRNGRIYHYYAVPPSVYKALMASESAGNYFNHEVKDRYPTEPISRR